MTSSADQPGQESPEEAAQGPAEDNKPSSRSSAEELPAEPAEDAPSGEEAAPAAPGDDEPPPATASPDGKESHRTSGTEQASGPADQDAPSEEQKITDRMFDAGAEWFREQPGQARMAGRDYHEHRVTLNLTVSRPGADEIIGYELPGDACAAIQRLYVRPEGFDEAHSRLGERRLLFLSGPPQIGKGMAANYLALSHAGETGADERPRKLVRLEPTTPVAALHRYDFEKDTAYVIDTLAPRRARELEPFHLQLLEQRLHKASAYLVVSVDDGSLSHPAAREGNTLDWRHIPGLALVLRRHAMERLGDAPEARELVRMWLGGAKVAAVLPKLQTPQDAVELAEELARAAGDDTIGADEQLDLALDRHGARTATEAVAMFDGAGLEKRAWLLAIAGLEGCPFSTVAEARERLRERLPASSDPGVDGEQPPVGEELRLPRRTVLLNELGAEPYFAYVPHAHGYAKAVCVRFRGPGTARAILRHSWDEHDSLRLPILAWLDDLINERSEIAWEIAQTLGQLATFDFSYLLSKVFEPWLGEDVQRRVAVAVAVGWPARDENQRQQVHALVRHWADNGSVRERWTAAVACGSVYGLSYPDKALDALRRIAKTGDVTLRYVVPRSLDSLFAAGTREPGLHVKVLLALQEWTDRRLREADIGRRAFLLLVKPGPGRHAAIWLADDPAYVAPLATLWRRLLDTPTQRWETLLALRQAFEEADHDPGLSDKLAVLVEEIARTARNDECDRLRYQLATWGNRRRAPSATARRCLGLIPPH
jgi:hypothetical protein